MITITDPDYVFPVLAKQDPYNELIQDTHILNDFKKWRVARSLEHKKLIQEHASKV